MVAPAFRYPDNETVPEYLRGRTAEDAAAIIKDFVTRAGQSAAIPPAPQELPPPADDEYVTAQHMRQNTKAAIAQVSPWLQSVADQQATFAYNLAKRDQADTFKKYEPEILTTLQSVPRANWTLDVIGRAVNLVKGNHVDEIVAGKVRDLEQTMASTMRSTGRAGLNPDSPLQETVEATLGKTPPDWLEHAKLVGITPEQVREFCQANEMSPSEFFDQFKGGIVSDAVGEVSFKRALHG